MLFSETSAAKAIKVEKLIRSLTRTLLPLTSRPLRRVRGSARPAAWSIRGAGRFFANRLFGCGMHCLAAYPGFQHLGLRQIINRAGQWIAIDQDHIRELAGLQ